MEGQTILRLVEHPRDSERSRVGVNGSLDVERDELRSSFQTLCPDAPAMGERDWIRDTSTLVGAIIDCSEKTRQSDNSRGDQKFLKTTSKEVSTRI